ncbi:MAG: CHAP domain-containing protein [Ruminococcaceae bacterium]|nr:CHAP domain-containing protein [Oscillospiraceae bacterium]
MPATGGRLVSVQAATQAAGNAQRTRAAANSVRVTARKATEAASRAVRDIIAGARTLVAALTAGGTVSVIIVVILCLVGLLMGSGFGIFFSGENHDTGQTLQSVIRQVNDEYAERLDELRAGYSYNTVEVSGSRAPWQDILAVYAVHTTASTDVMMMDDARATILKDIFWLMHEITAVPGAEGILSFTITPKPPDDMADHLGFTSSQRSQLAELLSEEYRSLWNAAIYGTDGNTDIVAVALSQIGNVSGEPYWSWYGFESRVEWCACFVSWCANECGYLEAGILPRFASCSGGVQWFRERGLWRTGSYIPKPGDIIFFDWADEVQDGSPDHVGIVERVGESIIYTIEGNSGDACKAKSYSIDHAEILGYGTYNP